MTILNYQLWKRVLPYAVFTLLLIIYAKDYYGKLFPNDAVSYLSIATKYATGNFSTAINAYWSPMISWLIALQIKLGIPAILAFHIVKLLSGLLIIFFTEKIIRLYHWPSWALLVCSTIVAAWAAYFTLHYLSPDALMAAGLLLYLYLILNNKWLQRPWLTGLLGATLYFTKAFGFYFFAAHLLLYVLWKLIADGKQSIYIVKKGLVAFSVFLAINFTWISTLHQRYDIWMVSSAGSYNHGLMQYGNGSVQPVLRSGLLPLPDSTAYNSWEEITLVHTYTDWKPWQSRDYFLLQLKVIRNNGWYILQHVYGANRLAWPAIVAGLLLIIFFAYKRIIRKQYLNRLHRTAHVATFIFLYGFGYAVAGVDERYLYITDICLLFISIDLLVLLVEKYKLPSIIFSAGAGLLIIQCIYEVTGKLNFSENELISQTAEIKSLQQIIPKQSIVATHHTNAINAMDYWGQWHNHGGLSTYQTTDSAKQALRNFNINWVLIPDSVQQQYPWLAAQSDSVFNTKMWKVYKLKTFFVNNNSNLQMHN